MRKNILLIVIILITITSFSQTRDMCKGEIVIFTESFNPCNDNPWVMVFEDNFENNVLDNSIWVTNNCRNRYCNPEQQYYTDNDNIEITNGFLRLITKRDTVYARTVDWMDDDAHLFCDGIDKGQNKRWFYYTSANIETIKMFSYGKFEARIKIPKGKGFWPAFWLFGQNPIYNEIDIFEFDNDSDLSKLSKVHKMNIHYDYSGIGDIEHCSSNYESDDFSEDFHIFTLIWDKNEILWYVDGNLKRRDNRYMMITGQEVGCSIEDMIPYIRNEIFTTDPMNIILNIAIQSDFGPDNSTVFPSQMEVDWVRYYQRKSGRNIIVSDSTQYPIIDNLYNVIAGDDININCSYTILEGQQLVVCADEKIKLGPGFCSKNGSMFCARINVSDEDYNSIMSKSNNKENSDDNYKVDNVFLGKNNLSIYPNPSTSVFKIDFGMTDILNYDIIITNIEGQMVKKLFCLNSSVITVDMSNYNKGVYIVYILNNVNYERNVYKLVLK